MNYRWVELAELSWPQESKQPLPGTCSSVRVFRYLRQDSWQHGDRTIEDIQIIRDTLAERLRRRPAKPMGSPRVGSNPTGVVLQ